MAAPVALVTGASRGIGRATALALADAGYDVAGHLHPKLAGPAIVVRTRRNLLPGWPPP